MKAQGKVIYPIQKIESGKARIKALIEQQEAAGQVIDILDNISPEELNAILEKAKKLSENRFTAAEAQELGVLIVNAVKYK
jgi:hypothetical protein